MRRIYITPLQKRKPTNNHQWWNKYEKTTTECLRIKYNVIIIIIVIPSYEPGLG